MEQLRRRGIDYAIQDTEATTMTDYSLQQADTETKTIELMGLPRRGGFGNLVAAFDHLASDGALLVVDNRDLTWVLRLFRDVRGDQLDTAQSHAFEKPENYFLYLVKNGS